MSHWTLFRPKGTGKGLKGKVSVHSGGLTVAKDLAHYLTSSKNIDKKAVEVYHDEDGRLGLKPGEFGYKPRKTDSGALRIRCKAVINGLQLITGQYPATWSAVEEMIVFKPRREG